METIRKVDYFAVDVANKPGEGARLLGALRDAGVNLLAFTGFPKGRRAQIDFLPEDSAALSGLRASSVHVPRADALILTPILSRSDRMRPGGTPDGSHG